MRRHLPSFLLAAAGLLCLWAAGSQNAPLRAARARATVWVASDRQDVPPIVMFTAVVLGGFRGLIADALWLRLIYVQDRFDYFEMVQLADWITTLEPDCAEIWVFHAWNLAYNVSVMMPDDADRWRWVRNGIQLLRDRGISYNPTDPDLYAELAWIFLHKIGMTADPAHPYYRQQWALEMTGLLGSGRVDYDALAARPDTLRRMREEYRLDFAIMKELDAAHGPLDWTRPETHALYWAYRGTQHKKRGPSLVCDADTMFRHSLRALSGKTGETDHVHAP